MQKHLQKRITHKNIIRQESIPVGRYRQLVDWGGGVVYIPLPRSQSPGHTLPWSHTPGHTPPGYIPGHTPWSYPPGHTARWSQPPTHCMLGCTPLLGPLHAGIHSPHHPLPREQNHIQV